MADKKINFPTRFTAEQVSQLITATLSHVRDSGDNASSDDGSEWDDNVPADISTVPARRHSRELAESTSEDEKEEGDEEDDEEEEVTRCGRTCGGRSAGHTGSRVSSCDADRSGRTVTSHGHAATSHGCAATSYGHAATNLSPSIDDENESNSLHGGTSGA